jgi:hypothetical protein
MCCVDVQRYGRRAESGCCAGGESRDAEPGRRASDRSADAGVADGSADSRASADAVPIANHSATAGNAVGDAISTDAGFKRDTCFQRDVTADSQSRYSQCREQRTRHYERQSGAGGYADQYRTARIARCGYDGQQTGLLANAWHRKSRVRASRHFSRRLTGRRNDDAAAPTAALTHSAIGSQLGRERKR